MAVAFVAARGTRNLSSNTSTTLTTSGAVTAGNFLIINVGRFCSTPTSTITVSGGGLTWTATRDSGNGQVRSAQWRAHCPSGLASGSSITIANSSASDFIAAASEYSGIDSTSPVTAVNSGTGSTAGWSSGNVAGNSGDGLIGMAFIDNGSTSSSTPTSPGTERLDLNVGGQSETLTVVDKLSISGTDAIAGTWNAAGSWASVAGAYKPAAGGATDYPLDAQPGSYTVTGQAAQTLSGRAVSANPATYAVTGTAATLPIGRFITASPGSYALTGTAATLLAARALNAALGTYTVTGTAATTAAGRLFTAEPGSYTITGVLADLLYEQPGVFELNAETGVFTVTGQAAGLLATRLLNANPGTYTLTGTQAGVTAGRAINAQPATLTVTGNAATFLTTRLLNAAAGAYTLTGHAAEIAPAGQAAPTATLLITFREPPRPSFREPGPATHREPSRATFREGR